ncbi:MAG TPA: hypothetical protein VK179_05010 [Bacteroidales bacterium]|nr:hypothetical protein [Bacteroidales bacterium]
MHRLFLYLIVFSFVQVGLSAQERTHLPYSVYGIGQILPKGFTRNLAMGRTGIALSSPAYLNSVNPASLHTVDSISFFFDFGLNGDIVKYSTSNEGTQKGNDFNIHNIAIGFSVMNNWKASIGISPYSSVGYKIKTTEEIQGTPNGTYNVQKSGSGGLNQFYINNSFTFFKHLSLGVSMNYLFGTIESSEKINAPDLMTNDLIIKQSRYLKKFYADFGAQYFFPVNKNIEVTLGGIFGNTHYLTQKDKITVYEFQGDILKDENTDHGTFKFPMYFGGGFSVMYKNSLTISGDYIYQDWSNTSSNSSNFKYRSNNIIRAGIELIPGRFNKLGYFGGISYRLGYYHEESYLQFRERTFADNGITAGLGFPILQNRTTINFSYNYGINGTLENRLVKEKYQMFIISLTLHDWWFMKRQID